MKKALGEMVEVRALINTVLWTLGSMLLIMALNPVAPALVAVVGLGLILYVGVDTLLNLVNGWRQLMDDVKVATTFEQIREAGERFGKLLGREAARAFTLLLMAAIGSTAKLFAAKVPTLPGSPQVAVQAEGRARIPLSALGTVEKISLTAEGVSVTVAATAMTMGASGSHAAINGAHDRALLQTRRRGERPTSLASSDAQGPSGCGSHAEQPPEGDPPRGNPQVGGGLASCGFGPAHAWERR